MDYACALEPHCKFDYDKTVFLYLAAEQSNNNINYSHCDLTVNDIEENSVMIAPVTI